MGTSPEIARWWRRRTSRGGTSIDPASSSAESNTASVASKSTNPRTLLLQVTRSEDGVAFIRGRVRTLREELRLSNDAEKRFLLALYIEKLGEKHLKEALQQMDNALARILRQGFHTKSGEGSPGGWAKSERARLAKAVDSFSVRQTVLMAHGQCRTLSHSPAHGTTTTHMTLPTSTAMETNTGDRKRQREEGTVGGSLDTEDEPVRYGRERQRETTALNGQDTSVTASLTPIGPSPRFRAVDERSASSLSYEEFIETYALSGRPLVIRGGVECCFEAGQTWDRARLKAEAAEKMVPVRRWIPDSVSWARLEDAGQLPLGRLLDLADSSARDEHASYDSGNNSGGGYVDHHELETDKDKGGRSTEPLYLHDWSVPQNLGTNCSLLAGSFKVPKFFAGDMLQRVAGQGLLYTDSWPSLFVGPKGSKSDTHIDSFGSHFWMGLLEGKKRWLIYPKEDTPLLYPVWPEGCLDPVFEADLESPDEERHPAALLAEGYECILEAGDILFVPAGSAHRVVNLTDTLALSCNYVDATNIDGALTALEDQALIDSQRPGALAQALRRCDRSLCRRQQDLCWAALRKWPRMGEMADWVPRCTSASLNTARNV